MSAELVRTPMFTWFCLERTETPESSISVTRKQTRVLLRTIKPICLRSRTSSALGSSSKCASGMTTKVCIHFFLFFLVFFIYCFFCVEQLLLCFQYNMHLFTCTQFLEKIFYYVRFNFVSHLILPNIYLICTNIFCVSMLNINYVKKLAIKAVYLLQLF